MGYSFSVDEVQFRLPQEKQRDALHAARAITGNLHWIGEGISECKTIADVFEQFGWHEEYDDDGHIVNLQFWSEKIGDEKKLWTAIAPFVDAGSYIQCHGEDGSVWRWVFVGGCCFEKNAKMEWD